MRDIKRLNRAKSEHSLWMNRSFRYVHHQGSCRPGMPIIDYRFTSLKKLATLTDSIQIKLRMVQQSLSSATKRSGEDRIDSKNSQDDTDSHAAILLSQESAIEFCVNVLNSEKFALQICGKTKVTRAKKQGKQVDNSRQILYTKFLAILRSFCLSDMSYKILADCVEDFVNSKIGQNVQKDFKEFVIDDMQRTEFEIMENIPNANLKSDYLKKKMLQIIKIRNSKFLGITVISSHYNILVGRVIHGSFSHRNRLFQPGDEILEINDIPLKCRSVEEVINLINNSKSEIKFLVSKSNKSSLKDLLIPENLEPIYVKALYDYDPNEDAQIECPEIALPFFSGDILRIVEYSDTIWQAYIHGDDSQTIAGLIPGKMMFEERIKRELMGSANNSSSFCLPPIIRSPKSNPLIQVYEKLQLYSPPRGSNWLFLVICDEPCKKLRRSLANSKDLTLIRNPVKSTRLGQRQRDELEKFYGVPMVYMDDKEWRECETNSSEFFDFKSNHFDQKLRLKVGINQTYVRNLCRSGPSVMLESSAILQHIAKLRIVPYIIFVSTDTQSQERLTRATNILKDHSCSIQQTLIFQPEKAKSTNKATNIKGNEDYDEKCMIEEVEACIRRIIASHSELVSTTVLQSALQQNNSTSGDARDEKQSRHSLSRPPKKHRMHGATDLSGEEGARRRQSTFKNATDRFNKYNTQNLQVSVKNPGKAK